MDSQEALFTARIMDAVRQCHDLGYNASRFEQMLRNYGVLNTVKRLVVTGDPQKGLARLKELNRLDLAVESIMLNTEFSSLFSEKELAAARWHLEQL